MCIFYLFFLHKDEYAEHAGLKGGCFVELQGRALRLKAAPPAAAIHALEYIKQLNSSQHSTALLTSIEVIQRADHSKTKWKHGGQQDQKHPEGRQISREARFER